MSDAAYDCQVLASEETAGADRTAAPLLPETFGTNVVGDWAVSSGLLAGDTGRLVVLDTGGDGPNTLRLLSQVRQTRPGIAVLVLIEKGDVATAVAAMKAGATDCLEKPITREALLASAAHVESRTDPAANQPTACLTTREHIVLQHLLEGRTNRYIATVLCRSPRTIEVHRRSIMRKLHASNRASLVRQAHRAGLVDPAQAPQTHCQAPPVAAS